MIDPAELRFTYSSSSGPGGQHVNTTRTRATLWFDVDASAGLTEAQKRRIRDKLATRISKEGVLRVVCQAHRSRERNRLEAIERFERLIEDALRRPKKRRKTRVPTAAKRRRLDDKRKRSELKRSRRTSGE